MTMFRDAGDKEYAALVAENRFITDIQLEIERTLDELNMTQADLARAAKLSEARVSQILSSNGKNLQARTIARIAHVLGLAPRLQFLDKDALYCAAADETDDGGFDFKKWTKTAAETLEQQRECEAANENECHLAAAA